MVKLGPNGPKPDSYYMKANNKLLLFRILSSLQSYDMSILGQKNDFPDLRKSFVDKFSKSFDI